VLGLDGASWDVIDPLVKAGRLPRLAAWRAQGAAARLASSVPPMSFPAWSSFATGLGPGRHGLFDFTQKLPGAYRLRFSNASDRLGATLFARASRAGRRVLARGMPAARGAHARALPGGAGRRRSPMTRMLRASLAIAAAVLGFCWLASGGTAADASPAVLDALFPSGRETVPLAALAERVTLAPGEDFRVTLLARDTQTSQHLVAIRRAEIPHRHDRHALLVVMLRGHGRMRLGAEERPVGEGSILYVPQGTVHAFRNESPEPAVAYAVYLPAFDGRDRVETP